MVIFTFLVGLLPVVGNLVSNTVIVILSFSVSAVAAVASLCFLVAIHKLEYFLNAHLIGNQIHAHAWELLLAMRELRILGCNNFTVNVWAPSKYFPESMKP